MRRKLSGFYVLALVLFTLAGAGWLANGQATVLTTNGHEFTGAVTGIGGTPRLNLVPAAGPIRVFDIPRSAIRQIIIDFPRLIVETSDKVYIGPFSDFTGIDEQITVHSGNDQVTVPLAGLRAIALNGNAVHPTPRVWVGTGFLTRPVILVSSPANLTPVGHVSTPASSPTSEHPINWAKINPNPVLPPPEPQGASWWAGVIALVGLVGLVYFSLTLGKG